MTRIIALPFFGLAAVGLVVSAIVHFASWLGFAPPGPLFVGLHLGVFVVWFPGILLAALLNWPQVERVRWGDARRIDWRQQMQGRPHWLAKLALGSFVYAIINFILGFVQMIVGFGDESVGARMFSGHWMTFYAFGMVMLYPFRPAAPTVAQPPAAGTGPGPNAAPPAARGGATNPFGEGGG